METVLEAMRLMRELEAMRPISPEQEARILQKFRLDWNYHSNRIEGNSLTFQETKSLLLYGITAQGKPLKDHIEITRHNEALNWVLDVVKGGRPLTESFIRELHQLLLKEPYEVDAITPDGKPTKRMIQIGQYKTVPNHVRTVTGETHFFASVEETPAMVHELMDWYRAQREISDTNPIFLSALFHHRFISIHPFDDGNGRTGRLLMNFILMQYGYPPVIIKTEDKINYYRALQQADGGNTDAFVDYIAVNLQRSLQIMLAGARGESIEEPDDLDKELALLEQRLRGVGKKAEVLKSKEAIVKIVEGSFWKLGELVLQFQSKFEGLYSSMKSSFEGINLNSGSLNFEERNREEFLQSLHDGVYEVRFRCFSRAFLQIGLGEFSYQSEFQFRFGQGAYQVIIADKTILEKGYNEQLTAEEINSIAREEAQKHIKFIQVKLDAFLTAG
jgi:Fic family protein